MIPVTLHQGTQSTRDVLWGPHEITCLAVKALDWRASMHAECDKRTTRFQG